MTPQEHAASVVARYNLLTGEDREQYLREMIAAAIVADEHETRAKAIEECARIADETSDALDAIRYRSEDQEGGYTHAVNIAKLIRSLAETPAPAATGGTAASDPAATSETLPDVSRPTNARIAEVVGWLLEGLEGERKFRARVKIGYDTDRLDYLISWLSETLEAHTP